MKRLEKPSLSEISPIHNNSLQYKNNYDFNYCAEYANNQQHYADDFMNQQQEMINEMSLHERLQHNRKCFHQFSEQIGNLKDTKLNVKDTIIAKQCPMDFPPYVELLKIYEKDIQKMQVTKTLKKNWNEDDIIILIWCVMKYCAHHNVSSHKNLTESDWQFIANMVPGKDKESCRFKWLKMCKVNIQDEPWTKEENEILPTIVNQVQEKGKKDWVEVSTRLFYETNQKIYRTPKQCREHFNNYHDPDIKKYNLSKEVFLSKQIIKINRGSWTQEEDLELLKLAKELGKKWSIIAKKLKGRTENAVKNRFHAIFRKHIEKNEKAGIQDSFDDSQIYESEEVSSEQNQNSGGNGGTIDSPLGKDMVNEKKLINKLIKNIENNLKINSSECYSSDNNSVYSDSSRNSKAFKKQKHKMLQFIHKNYESMSSDDDTSRHSPSPHTAQKSIFSKAYSDQIKCKQDEDGEMENTNSNNALGYQSSNSNLQHQNHPRQHIPQESQFKQNSRNNSENPKTIESNSPYKAPNFQKQNNYQPSQYQQQLQGSDDKNKNGMYQQQQGIYLQNGINQQQQQPQQQQQQQQGIQPSQGNIASNPHIGSQNFDFFNQQIVLGGQINQSKADSIEEFVSHSYQEIPNQNNQQNQNQGGFVQQKIPSLEHIDMKDEIKLKVMNYQDLQYNEQDQYSYAVVNLSKNEIFLTPPSQQQQMQKIWAYASSNNNNNTKVQNNKSMQMQQEVDQINFTNNNTYENSNNTKAQNKAIINTNSIPQYQNTQNSQNIMMQQHKQNSNQQQQIGIPQQDTTLNFQSTHPQQILPPTTNILGGAHNTQIITQQAINQNQAQVQQTQPNNLYQSQPAYYNDYNTAQNTGQHFSAGIQNTAGPAHVTGMGTNMMGIPSFSTNNTQFQVIGNMAQSINQINPMKIEDGQSFLFMQRNSFDLSNNNQAFIPYTDNTQYNPNFGGQNNPNNLNYIYPTGQMGNQYQQTINTMNKQ
ncbi:hypothetical protein ABPG74_015947 [Tetrahymena malaccensis]